MRAPSEVVIGIAEGTFRHGAGAAYLRTLAERTKQLRPLPVHHSIWEAADKHPPGEAKPLGELLKGNAPC